MQRLVENMRVVYRRFFSPANIKFNMPKQITKIACRHGGNNILIE